MKTIPTEYEENASESMFCQATGLPQCVADRASDSLADGRQNKVQIVQPAISQLPRERKFRRNTIDELRRKRLRRNNARKIRCAK